MDAAQGIGLWLDPSTGEVMIAQSLYVVLECMVWIGAVVAGLVTAWLVLP
jgi:hypothetical protein